MKITIGRRIVFVFAGMTLIAAGLGTFAYKQLHNIGFFANGTLQSIYIVGQLEALANETGTLIFKHVLSNDSELKADLDKTIQADLEKMNAITAELGNTVSTDKDRELFAKLNADQLAYETALNDVVKMSDKPNMLQPSMEQKEDNLDPAFERL